MYRNHDKSHHYNKGTNMNETKNEKKSNENIGNIDEKYLKLLKVQWAKTSVLSNSVLQSIPLDKFNYSEKIDGFHRFLLIYDKKVYNVTHIKFLKLIILILKI